MEEKTMLSQGEWRIMNLLWKKKNRTIMEMVEDFAGVTDWDKQDRKSTRLNSSHKHRSRMPSSA